MKDRISIPIKLKQLLDNFYDQNIDAEFYKCGEIELYSLSELAYSYVNINIKKENRVYYLKVIDLVKECEKYSPEGLLLWLPDYSLFATYYDNSVYVFPKSSLNDALKDVYKIIDLQWDDNEEYCHRLDDFSKLKDNYTKNQIKGFKKHSLKNHRINILSSTNTTGLKKLVMRLISLLYKSTNNPLILALIALPWLLLLPIVIFKPLRVILGRMILNNSTLYFLFYLITKSNLVFFIIGGYALVIGLWFLFSEWYDNKSFKKKLRTLSIIIIGLLFMIFGFIMIFK